MGSVIYIPKKDNPIFYPEYGVLYNWYAATDARNIASTGWKLPSSSDLATLSTYYGGVSSGGNLKEIGFIYWMSPNTGADNISNFSARGGGYRSENGSFIGFRTACLLNTADAQVNPDYSKTGRLNHSSTDFYTSNWFVKKGGGSIRLLKDTTALSHGETGTYTGNDGKVYRTICIGTQEWLADNLCETGFRNGDIIPWHGADPANYFTNAEWAALTTAGCCAYDNTLANVATGFTFPT